MILFERCGANTASKFLSIDKNFKNEMSFFVQFTTPIELT